MTNRWICIIYTGSYIHPTQKPDSSLKDAEQSSSSQYSLSASWERCFTLGNIREMFVARARVKSPLEGWRSSRYNTIAAALDYFGPVGRPALQSAKDISTRPPSSAKLWGTMIAKSCWCTSQSMHIPRRQAIKDRDIHWDPVPPETSYPSVTWGCITNQHSPSTTIESLFFRVVQNNNEQEALPKPVINILTYWCCMTQPCILLACMPAPPRWP